MSWNTTIITKAFQTENYFDWWKCLELVVFCAKGKKKGNYAYIYAAAQAHYGSYNFTGNLEKWQIHEEGKPFSYSPPWVIKLYYTTTYVPA